MAKVGERAGRDNGTSSTLCAAHGEGLMSIVIVRKALLWCIVINDGVLLVWFSAVLSVIGHSGGYMGHF